MTVAETIADRLAHAGVKYMFGIPGGPSIPYMEALRSAGIEFILVSNEASAGIMADVTGRMTGVPGVCHATFGPGATNITTGVGEALLDRSPLIVFTSEIGEEMIARTTQMNIDHQKLFAPVTKATFRMTRHNAASVMNAALSICLEEYPGPVHIGLPAGIADQPADGTEERYVPEPVSHHNDLQRILSLLESSRRPVLAAGLTAARHGIGKQLIDFLGRKTMPVVLTPMAKGLLPESHPCYAGVLFHSLSDYLEDIWEKADLVIGLGYDQVEFNYESWMPAVPLVHFDTRHTDLPAGAARFTGPPDEWFSMLRNMNESSLSYDEQLIRETREEIEAVFSGFRNRFGPSAALGILREELPADTIITADVGSHLHLIGQSWHTGGKPNLLMTNGWSGMGFGIPAALAAQVNEPGSTVACITGDGGFLMMAGEIITARRYSLPVIIVIFSDGELNLIKVKQSWKELPPYGTLLYQDDLFGTDRFFGVKVLRANSHETMRNSVNEALALGETVIINAVIDPEEYRWLIVKR